MLATLKEVLEKAEQGNYAVGAFNVENMEMVMAVISAAEEMNAPVILWSLEWQLWKQQKSSIVQ